MQIDNELFENWNSSVALALESIGSANFPSQLKTAISLIAAVDNLMVFHYPHSSAPSCFYSDFTEEIVEICISGYLEGPYLLDSFYSFALECSSPIMKSLDESMPDEFKESEFYNQHYHRTNIEDEVGFFIPLGDQSTIVLSITRQVPSLGFSIEELTKLRNCANLICILAKQQWQIKNTTASRKSNPLKISISGTLNKLGDEQLSEREMEVLTLGLRGYSIHAIGSRLSIQISTVKVHRKNGYLKLGISSQTELFGQFLNLLREEIKRLS